MKDKSVKESDFDKAKKRILFSGNHFEMAKVAWEADSSVFLKGANGDHIGALALRDDYTKIDRLRYDYEKLLEFRDASTPNKIIYVLDPHILHGFAATTDYSTFRGFEFIKNEWKDDQGNGDLEKLYYLLYLYSAIFNSGELCILEEGREQILEYLVYFKQQVHKYQGKNKLGYFPEQRLERYEELIGSLETLEKSESPDELMSKFSKLVASASASEIYADISLNRLNTVMTRSNFQNYTSILRGMGIESDKLAAFFDLTKNLRSEGQVLTEAQTQAELLFGIYDEQTDLTRLSLQKSGKEIDATGRGRSSSRSEHRSRTTLLRIHRLNTCLDICDVDVEFRYITSSTYLFNFIKPLQKIINASVVHPRMYFAYSDDDFYQSILKSKRDILSHISGSAAVIANDGKITKNELAGLEGLKSHLLAFRNADAFGGANQNIIDQFLKSLSHSVSKLQSTLDDGHRDHYNARASAIIEKCSVIEEHLKTGVLRDRDAAADLLNERFDPERHDDSLYEVFSQLASMGDIERHPLIAARIVFEKTTGAVKRIVCMPVKGSYRYTFGITNSDIMDVKTLSEQGLTGEFKVFDINHLISAIDMCLPSEAEATHKNAALRMFIRSIHAASYRDWAFSLHLAREALEELHRTDSKDHNSRYHFLEAEVHYLIHMSIRGLAEQKFQGKRHLKELKKSCDALSESAKCIALAYKEQISASDIDETGYSGAMAFRLPLAYVGLCLEILVAQKKVGQRFDVEKLNFDDSSPFQDIRSGEGFKYYWEVGKLDKLSFKLVWSDPTKAVEIIAELLAVILATCKSKFTLNADLDDEDEFDTNIWNFRSMRASLMLFNVLQLVNVGAIYGRTVLADYDDDLVIFEESIRKYDDFLRSLAPAKVEKIDITKFIGPETASPYSRILCIASKANSSETASERYYVYEHLLQLESMLDPLGLPRSISRKIRKFAAFGKDGNFNLAKELSAASERISENFPDLPET